MLEYLRPDNLEDALLTLTEQPCTLLAGGTDFYPARVGKKITDNVLDHCPKLSTTAKSFPRIATIFS